MANPIPARPSLLAYKDLIVKRRALENDRFEEILIRPTPNSALWVDADGNVAAVSSGGNDTKYLRGDGTFFTPAGGGDVVAANNLDDMADAPTAFANIKQAASTSATGVVELATAAGAAAGTDTSRVVTPAGMKGAIDPLVNARAPAQGLVFNGTSKRVQSFGATGTAPLWVDALVDIPVSAPAANYGVLCLSSHVSTGVVANGLDVIIDTASDLVISLRGAATTDYNRATYALDAYAGKRIRISIARGSSGNLALYINSVPVTPTLTTGGTAPTWQGSITSTYLHIGGRGTEYFSGFISISGIENRLPSYADVLRLYETGLADPSANASASNTPTYTSNFSSTVDGWSGNAGATVAIGPPKLLCYDIASAYQGAIRAFSLVVGKRYRITFSAADYAGDTTISMVGGGGTKYAEFAIGTHTYEFIANHADILFGRSASGDTITGFSLTGITVVSVGSLFTAEAVPRSTQVVVHGDSLSAYNVNRQWAQRLVERLNVASPTTLINLAVNGNVAYTIATNYATEIHPYCPAITGLRSSLYIWAGTNDIMGGDTAAQIYANLKTIWAAGKADGFEVIASTITPRTDASGGQETIRGQLNTLILSDLSLFDRVMRPDLLFPDATDLTWYNGDGVHHTARTEIALANYYFGVEAIGGGELGLKLVGILEYADNAAAVTAGKSVGHVYRTGDALKIVHA